MRFVFPTIWHKEASYVSFLLRALILPYNFEIMATCDQTVSGTGLHCGKRKLNEHFTRIPYESKDVAKTLQKFVEAQRNFGPSGKTLDADILKPLPEAVRNFFLLYVKEVNAINELYECLGLFLENSKSLFNDNNIISQVQKVSNKGKRNLQMLTESIIEKLESSCQSTSDDFSLSFESPSVKLRRVDSFESYVDDTKPTFEDDDIDLAGSDIELQLDEIIDKTSNDKSASAQSSISKVNSDTSMGQEMLPSGNHKKSCNFNYDPDGYVKAFIDGSCLSNGRSNAKAGIGVWFSDKNPLNVSEPVTGLPTNNNAEIQAATKAILKASSVGVKKLRLYTDSQFVINCMTKWIFQWKRQNWINSSNKPVINKISLMELDKVLPLMDAIDWQYVEGHKGILGNERADFLAREGARKM